MQFSLYWKQIWFLSVLANTMRKNRQKRHETNKIIVYYDMKSVVIRRCSHTCKHLSCLLQKKWKFSKKSTATVTCRCRYVSVSECKRKKGGGLLELFNNLQSSAGGTTVILTIKIIHKVYGIWTILRYNLRKKKLILIIYY